MARKVIAIISVLKPVDDSRNFEKIAATIGNTNKYDINIIGFSSKKIPSAPNTTLHPLFSFDRLSLARFTAPLKIFRLILKLKPELIIVTSSDLLIVTSLYKILFGCKVIYDVQENYYRNIIYSGAYHTVLKYPLAWAVRMTEIVNSPFIDKFIIAEKIYADQLHFDSKKSVIIENKASIPAEFLTSKRKKSKGIELLYCGTISEHYGVFDAIDLVLELSNSMDNISLNILGYAAQLSVRYRITELSSQSEIINILSIDTLVPHSEILMEMNKADFVIMPYQSNKATKGRIPTKLFECLVMEIPVIINMNDAWNSIIEENNAGIFYDFASKQQFPVDKLHYKFYGNNCSQAYTWENNVPILEKTIHELID